MQDVVIEIVEGDVATALPPVPDVTALEVYVDQPVAVEILQQLPDTHYKVGGDKDTAEADPSVLVWYDIEGVQ